MTAMTGYAAIGTVPEPDAGFTSASEEDDVARRLLRPCFPSDRELLLLAGFDAFERLTAFESVDEGTAARCTIAPCPLAEPALRQRPLRPDGAQPSVRRGAAEPR